MDNLEPITRNEMFLNGDDLEPITREEMILAGEDLEPITRHEWFLKKYRGGGGGGGYDLVNIPDLPADIASFNDGTDLPMASLKVTVTPVQDLSHGDPSPENICPIIGWDEAVVTVADDAESPTTSHEYTIDLDGTRYGGVLDATNGTMTVNRVRVTIDGLTGSISRVGTNRFNIDNLISGYKQSVDYSSGICSLYKSIPQKPSNATFDAAAIDFGACYDFSSNSATIRVKDQRYDSVDDFSAMLAIEKPTIVYELATPITVQLAPQPVKSLEGENNISANCGQITEGKYFKRA